MPQKAAEAHAHFCAYDMWLVLVQLRTRPHNWRGISGENVMLSRQFAAPLVVNSREKPPPNDSGAGAEVVIIELGTRATAASTNKSFVSRGEQSHLNLVGLARSIESFESLARSATFNSHSFVVQNFSQ